MNDIVAGIEPHLGHPTPSRAQLLAKRMMDLLLGSAALMASLPILTICMILIKCTSRGPVFFSQTRIGRFGLPFRMYKLRTMRNDAEVDTGAVWASDNDPRVIPACRWMRISHMDELPQLWNVIRGEMSLVGPRPERLEIMLGLELEDRFAILRRLDVKPGITGLAQIRSGYDSTVESFQLKLEYDMEYIEKHSFWRDLWIILCTIPRLRDPAAK